MIMDNLGKIIGDVLKENGLEKAKIEIEKKDNEYKIKVHHAENKKIDLCVKEKILDILEDKLRPYYSKFIITGVEQIYGFLISISYN